MNTFLIITGVLLMIFLYYVLKPRQKDENGFKMWNFDENVWHARYFKWLNIGKLPQGGCVYFWMMFPLILLSPLIYIAYLLAKLSMWLYSFIPKKEAKLLTEEELYAKIEKEEKRDRKTEKIVTFIGKSLMILLIAFVIAILIYIGFNYKIKWLELLYIIGVTILFWIVMFFLYWVATKTLAKPFRYIWSIIVAIYTKSCPKIIWHKK